MKELNVEELYRVKTIPLSKIWQSNKNFFKRMRIKSIRKKIY